MKYLLCVSSLLTLLSCKLVNAQVAPEIEWQKCLGGTKWDLGFLIQQTTDGGFIVAGMSNSYNGDVTGSHGGSDGWVVKLDAVGNLVWQKSLGGYNDDNAFSIQQTTDGGYIVAGASYSNDGDVSGNHGSNDFWIVKLDSLGDLLWQKCLGGSSSDQAYSIQKTTDGGYIVAGASHSNDGDVSGNHLFYYYNGDSVNTTDYWIVKLDAIGNLVWQKSYGGSSWDAAHSIEQTADGGFIVAGESLSNDGEVTGNHGMSDYWIIKLDTIGNLIWEKSFGGSDDEWVWSVQQTTDEAFIVAGTTHSTDGDVTGNHGWADYWILKLDTDGNLIWQKTFGGNGPDEAASIQQTTDGGFIVAGTSVSNDGDVSGNHLDSLGYNTPDYWIVKLDADGNLVWQKSLGGSVYENAYSIQQTNEGGFIVSGHSASNDDDVSGWHVGFDNYSFFPDYWIVKLSADTATGIVAPRINSFSLSPNPTQSQLTINLATPASQVAIRVYDLQGREMNCESRIANVELNSIQLSTENLPDGFYTLQIINNKTGESEVGKFVKQK